MTDKAFEGPEPCTYCGMQQNHSMDCVYYDPDVRVGPFVEAHRIDAVQSDEITPADRKSKSYLAKRETMREAARSESPDMKPPEYAQFFDRLKSMVESGEVTPERQALAEARLKNVAGLLAEERAPFFEYLKRIKLPYSNTILHEGHGKKAIIITLEDIAESDMRKS